MECIEWAQKENRIFLRQALEARLIALYFDTKEYNKALQLGLSFICSHDITHTHGIIWCLPVLCDILKVTHGSSVAMCLWADTLMYIRLHTIHTHTHTHLTALCLGLPGWAGTRKVKPIWILLEQETVSGSGIRWAICKSAPRSRQITMPAPHHSVFYRPDALPAAQPTASKHWRHNICVQYVHIKLNCMLITRLEVFSIKID